MWKWVKEQVKRAWNWLSGVVPGVLIVVVAIDVAVVLFASAEVVGAAWSGIAAFISLALIIASMTKEARASFYHFAGSKSVILDTAITFICTWIGFSVSVTMGLAGLFIGLNVSGFLSLMRYINKYRRGSVPFLRAA